MTQDFATLYVLMYKNQCHIGDIALQVASLTDQTKTECHTHGRIYNNCSSSLSKWCAKKYVERSSKGFYKITQLGMDYVKDRLKTNLQKWHAK